VLDSHKFLNVSINLAHTSPPMDEKHSF